MFGRFRLNFTGRLDEVLGPAGLLNQLHKTPAVRSSAASKPDHSQGVSSRNDGVGWPDINSAYSAFEDRRPSSVPSTDGSRDQGEPPVRGPARA